jgi:uncharacterized caspase-like protein
MAGISRNLKPRLIAATLAFAALAAGSTQLAAQPAGQPASGAAPRLALVIGEAAYKAGRLSSSANDAGLIADTLQLAGFDVTGAADLDQDGLRRSLREFVDKAAAAGPDATVFVYLAGRGLQYAGENYFAPIDATIPRAVDAPLQAVRLSDYLAPLAQIRLKARIVVLDAARINDFAQSGDPLAGGLALVEPDAGSLYAFNAAPDTVAPPETGPYGVYARSLNEMLREGGLPVDAAFARARLRVSEQTKGALVPWDESRLAPAPVLFARAPGAPPPAVAIETQGNLRARPIRDYPVDQAYLAALEQDTLAAYIDFLNAYPNSPYAPRVQAMLAARREAVTWRRVWLANTPNAYWTYLQRYPRGPHAYDARLRLGSLNAALIPPPRFDAYEFDVPPPIEGEEVYFERPYVVFENPAWGPPPPVGYLLPPRPVGIDRAPPPPPYASLLPLPIVALPLLYALPAVRHGAFHAPAVVQAQQPNANTYYTNRAQAQPGQPNAATPPAGAPNAPATTPPAGAPLPHPAPGVAPGGRPLPHGGPGAPPATPPTGAAAPNGAPLPHPANAPNGAPSEATPPHGGPATPHPAAPSGAPLPHAATPPNAAPNGALPPHGAPGASPAAPPAPHIAPVAPPHAPPAPASEAPAPQAHPAPHDAPHAPAVQSPPPHPAATQPPHEQLPHPAATQPPHEQLPHPAAPPPPHEQPPHPAAPPPPHEQPPHPAAPPPPHEQPKPLAAPHEPPHPDPHERPRCGGPGEPPCR